MISASGRYVITYNGEIYSAAEIRPELEALGHRFRGHSDTEVIVEAVDEWGVRATSTASSACSPSRSGIARTAA